MVVELLRKKVANRGRYWVDSAMLIRLLSRRNLWFQVGLYSQCPLSKIASCYVDLDPPSCSTLSRTRWTPSKREAWIASSLVCPLMWATCSALWSRGVDETRATETQVAQAQSRRTVSAIMCPTETWLPVITRHVSMSGSTSRVSASLRSPSTDSSGIVRGALPISQSPKIKRFRRTTWMRSQQGTEG